MGKLTFLEDIRSAAQWYFNDARWSSDTRKYTFQWPSLEFPFTAAMHSDIVSNKIRIQIRKWIEENLDGTVIANAIDYTYHRYYGKPRTWDNSYQVKNYWVVFYFEDSDSELAFRLRFSEYVTTITKHHPKYPEDEDWCNATPAERLELE